MALRSALLVELGSMEGVAREVDGVEGGNHASYHCCSGHVLSPGSRAHGGCEGDGCSHTCTGRPSSGARVGSGLLCMSLQVFACHGHTRFHCVTSIWKKSEICAMFVTNDHTIVHKHD